LSSHRQLKTDFQYSVRNHLLLIIALVLALWIKNAPLFLAGQFVSEDSFYFYQTAYNETAWTAITTPYAGYLHVFPMLLAELLWNLPFRILPWVNHLVALGLCASLLSWLYTPYCRKLIPSDGLRFAGVLILAFTPFQPNLGMLLGLHWYLSFTLGIFLLGELPKGWKAISVASLGMLLTAWSAPATIVLLPIAIYRWWAERKQPSRYIPLCFAAASIAYLLAITFVFKPMSAQPGLADLSTAALAGWKMLHEAILYQSILGVHLSKMMAPALAVLIKILITGSLMGLLLQSFRRKDNAWKWASLLFLVAGMILALTMLRGHQSRLILEQAGIGSERYLTTPTFYVWTGILILLAPYLTKRSQWKSSTRAAMTVLLLCFLALLASDAPPLQGKTSLSEAFPHAKKVEQLKFYQDRFHQEGIPETLALPGWTPIEGMRLKIGGGRECQNPSDLNCVFGPALIQLSDNSFRVDWFGSFDRLANGWIQHERWGQISVLGYSNGYYWFEDTEGQKFLSGPAIYPRRFEYPFKNMIHIKKK